MTTLQATPAVLVRMNQQLDARQAVVSAWAARKAGDVPLRYIAPDVRKKLGDRLSSLSINYGALACSVVSERLRLNGATVNGTTDPEVWGRWKAAEMETGASQVHDLALSLGAAAVSVWVDSKGRVTPRVEHPSQVVWESDPATGDLVRVLKRWVDPESKRARAVLYERDSITAYESDSYVPVDVTTYNVGAIPSTGWRTVTTQPNPLGTPPFAIFVNLPTLENPWGTSEMASIADLNDALIKITTDLLVTSESSARPRRWATGIEIEVDDAGHAVDPWDGKTTTAMSEATESKFGQFAASDLTAYKTASEMLLRQLSALSGIPPYAVGLDSEQAASADAIRASESALVAKVEQRQRDFGPSWARVFRLMAAIQHGQRFSDTTAEISWGDAASKSIAQESDAAVKLFQSGVLSRETTLRRLGFTDDEIERELRNVASEAVTRAVIAGGAA